MKITMNKEKSMIRSVCQNGMLRRALKVVAVIGILICHSNTLWAQLENGKVYNFVNVGNNTSSLTISGLQNVSIATTNTSSYNQLWYVISNTDDTYSLRNLADGRYLRSSNATSANWSMVNDIDANCKFYCTAAGSGYTLRASNTNQDYHFMHYGANQGVVVCWEAGAAATQWTINEVSISSQELENNWAELDNILPTNEKISTYKTALAAIFSDEACTQLNGNYQSMTEAALANDVNYKALPAELQNMVKKVLSDNWEEANAVEGKYAWDSEYAQRFRVQLYEPYNNPDAAASVLGMNAHTNLNNPTGIYTNGRQALYIFVEGAIKDGASLYLATWQGHGKPGGYNAGYELKEGLNVITTYSENSAYCINYVVQTLDSSKKGRDARLRKLSDYESLKIHIEGGHITGFYNKMGDELWGEGDNAADWDYYAARANQTDLTILGKYITLQFPLNDADTEGNKGMNYYLTGKNNIEEILDEWDNIMLWERMLMGLAPESDCEAANTKYNSPYSDCNKIFAFTGKETNYPSDYADYYNVHGLSFGVGGDSYMYGGWDHCGYHYNTMGSVINDLPNNAGSHWGPGHEIGHQHQGPLNMRGLTEVTNNLFSNVVLWFYGETTSRYNGTEGALSTVLAAYNSKNGDFFSNNIWAQTHMYYKLFLYYHVLGHNTSFYPRLYEMLRKDPMGIEYEQDGAKCLLHFYKKCCEASGDDLTEFFRAHGFFKVMKNRFVGDYSNANYNMTQEQIDAAIAEVKSKKYPANVAVLFINDATGETIKSHKGDNLNLYGETTVCAEVGSYHTFVNGTKAENYTYALNGEEITMEGNGGIGFGVFNAKGEILAFADKKSFNINAQTAELLSTGQASVKVLNADNTEATATDIMDSNAGAEQRAVLGELLKNTELILDCTDETGTKVGFFKKDKLGELTAAYNNAKMAFDLNSSADYAAVYRLLLTEYSAVMADNYARVGVVEGTAYRIKNKGYAGRFMSVNSEKMVIAEENADKDAQKWYLVTTGTEGTYYLKNKSTGTYAKSISSSKQLDASAAGTEDAAKYSLVYIGDGSLAITEATGIHCAASFNVVGWNWDNTPASHWYLTAVESDEIGTARQQLTELIAQTEKLMGKIGVISTSNIKMNLTKENYLSNAECKETMYGDQFTSYSVLCDNNTTTFFHSDYSSQAPNEDHYIRIDVGTGNEVQYFDLYYTTRKDGNLCAPTKMAIEGSTDGKAWEILTDITSGLPTTGNTSHTVSGIGNGKEYRYIRMRVYGTSTGQKANEHYYFIVSELGLNKISYNEAVKDEFASMETGLLATTYKSALEAGGVLETATTAAELKDAYEKLSAQYNTLYNNYLTLNAANLKAKKAELASLAQETLDLINMCGIVNYTPAKDEQVLALQTNNNSEAYYLSTNAPEPKEGNIANLLDGDNQSFFHSAWSTDINQVHHLMVDMGEASIMDNFTFSYQAVKGPFPYEIKVAGATELNGTFTEFATFSKDDTENALPTEKNKAWTSKAINPSVPYRYLRFEVTNSGAEGINATPQGEYCFVMSEFKITNLYTPAVYTVDIDDRNIEGVTEDLIEKAYQQWQSAQSTHNYATEVSHLDKAIGELKAQYDALLAAIVIKVSVTEAGAATFYTPITVAIPDGVVAKYVKESENTGSTGILKYTKITDAIPANTAVVLVATQGDYKFASAPAETVETITDNVLFGYASWTEVEGSEHHGTGENGSVYALANKEAGVAFYHFVGEGYKAFKAYLDVTSLTTSGVRYFNILNEGDETGIESIKTEGNQTIHDISGRRVKEMQNGIYIVAGKKIVK